MHHIKALHIELNQTTHLYIILY